MGKGGIVFYFWGADATEKGSLGPNTVVNSNQIKISTVPGDRGGGGACGFPLLPGVSPEIFYFLLVSCIPGFAWVFLWF